MAKEGNLGWSVSSTPDTVKFTPLLLKHLASALPLEGVFDVLFPKGFSKRCDSQHFVSEAYTSNITTRQCKISLCTNPGESASADAGADPYQPAGNPLSPGLGGVVLWCLKRSHTSWGISDSDDQSGRAHPGEQILPRAVLALPSMQVFKECYCLVPDGSPPPDSRHKLQ